VYNLNIDIFMSF